MIGEFGTEVGNALVPPEQFFSSKATIFCRCDCPITPPHPHTHLAPVHMEFPILLAVSRSFSFCKSSPIVSPRHPMRAHPASIRGLHGSSPNLVQPRLPTPPLAITSLVLGYLGDTRKGGITENALDGVPGYLMPPCVSRSCDGLDYKSTRTPCCVYPRPWKHGRTLGTCCSSAIQVPPCPYYSRRAQLHPGLPSPGFYSPFKLTPSLFQYYKI